MAKVHQRVFASVGALLFLLSSVALTVAVLWSIHQQSRADKATQSASQSANQSNNQTTKPQEGKLEGTKLEGFTPVANVDQLQKIDVTAGNGDTVKAGDTVTAHYTGAVAATGIIFQSSHDVGQPATFPLSNVIQGWQEGVPGMKVGGKRRLLIPAVKAYGANPPSGSGIPANADLVFDIELVKIGQ